MESGIKKAVDLLADKFQSWIESAVQFFPNFVAALLVLLIFFGIGWVIRKVVTKILKDITSHKPTIKLLQMITGIVVVAVGIFIALSVLQLDKTVTSLLAGAGVAGLALGFAFQDVAGHFISGVILAVRHPFAIGDMIEGGGYYGYVHDFNLRCTIIETTQGQLVFVPNGELINNSFVNYTWDKKRRIDLGCGVSYGDDLDKAEKLAIEAVKALEAVKKDKPIQVVYKEFGDSSINFVIRFWVHFEKNYDHLKPQSDAIKAIKKKFDENNISIPFPIRTLDFGIKGGEKLFDKNVQVKSTT